MICFRCGSDVAEGSLQCGNCGQRFTGKRRTFTATTTSFRALEKRRVRAEKSADALPYNVGDVIESRFEVRELAGRGPLGLVYRVFDQEIEVEVALKVIHADLLPDDAARAAFEEAIRKVRRLSQQNIVRLYEPGADGDTRFVTMQFLEGLTLRKVMGLRQDKGQRFTAREVEPIFSQITMALGHAHRHVVHGNLAPENVVILPDVVKLTDFSMHQAVGNARFLAAQQRAGRQRYIAPEIVAGEPTDLRADLFSVGAILYELLTGRPFGANVAPVSAVLAEVGGDTDVGIDEIIQRATAHNPDDRYDSAEAFAEALGTYIDGREIESARQRAVADPLLPEDVTRKVRVPAELRAVRAETASAEVDELDVAVTLIPSLPEQAVAPAEESYVEELTDDDFDELLESTQSIDAGDRRAPGVPMPTPAPELALSAPAEVNFGQDAPSEESEQSGSWFLRSNLGFVVAIALIVGVAGLGAMWFLRDKPAVPPVAQPVDVTQPSTAPPSLAAVRAQPATVAASRVSAVVASAPTTAAPATQAVASAPASVAVASRAPASAAASKAPVVVAVASKASAPAQQLASKAPASKAPASKAPGSRAPASRAPASRAPASKAPASKAPASKAPASRAPASKAPPKRPASKPPAAPVSVAVATEPPAAPATEPSRADSTDELRCKPGMVLVKTAKFPKGSVKRGRIKGIEGVATARAGGAYCIDRYEYPGKGRRPRTSVNFNAAKGLCSAAGKRLCTDKEWLRACGGAFPYGRTFKPSRCNTEDGEGEERAIAAAGKFGKCRSPSGAYDMSGNVAEWTASQTVRGGDYTSADEDAMCRSGGRRSAGSARASIGLRCCSDFR